MPRDSASRWCSPTPVHPIRLPLTTRSPPWPQPPGGRVRGFASYSPHRDPADYFAEVSRCIRDLGFVGIKLHTIGHALNPLSVDGGTVFEAARELDVPVMLHTGPGIPFADPAMVVPRAKQFPDVRIILGHAGWSIFTGSAIAIAETFDNIYLETSWCRAPDLAGMVARIGARRVMYGSDHPRNIAPELAKYRSSSDSIADADLPAPATAEVGEPMPAFRAPSSTGQTLDSERFRGKLPLVIFFVPDSASRRSGRRIGEFNRNLGRFGQLRTQVIGVVPETAKRIRRQAELKGYNLPLLSDPDESIHQAFGIGDAGNPHWATFVVDRDGTIARTYRPTVRPGHAQQVLASIRALKADTSTPMEPIVSAT